MYIFIETCFIFCLTFNLDDILMSSLTTYLILFWQVTKYVFDKENRVKKKENLFVPFCTATEHSDMGLFADM